MDKRNRQAQLPIEPIYCAAPQEPHDILCPGSDDELDEPARLAKRLRYEEQGLRYLEGRPPRLISASLKGPFDKGWQNPWLPKRRNAKTPFSRPTAPRPAVKSTAPKAPARRPGSKNDTPMTRDSMQCHLPSPESNREVQLDDNASLDFEKRFLIRDWAHGVPSDTLDRDEFWAPDHGRGTDPRSNSKKRPATSNWLKSKLSKRKMSSRDATSSTIHIPTLPSAVIGAASTALDPDLPITSLEMTTPSSSTGLCSAKSMGKTFDPVGEEEDTVMSRESVSSSGDESQEHVSQQDANGVVVDTKAPHTSSPRPSEDHRKTLPARIEADIAFESHMDDSFHYWIRPIRQEVARSASPILITTETGTRPEQTEPSGQAINQRSKSCGVQEPTIVKDHPKQDYQLAAILDRANDTAEEPQEAHPNEPTFYRRALSLPSQLCSEGCTATAALDATKRAKSLGPEHQPEKHYKPATSRDQDAGLVPIGDIAMPKNRGPVMDHTNLPTTRVARRVATAPNSSHAGEAEGAQDVQMEGLSNEEVNATSAEILEVEGERCPSTYDTSFEKLVSEDNTTLVGDATHIGHKPQQDACVPGSDCPSVSDSLSRHPKVDVVAEVVCSATPNETPIQSAVSGLAVPQPELETVLVEDVAQEAPRNGLEFENPAAQQTASPMELGVPEQTAGSSARLPSQIEERPRTPNMDEDTSGEDHPEERPETPDMDESTGEEDRFEETSSAADVDGHTGKEKLEAVDDGLVSPFIEVSHIAEPGTLDLQSEPIEVLVTSPRRTTPASTPTSCPGQKTVSVSQQTPWASTSLEATLELELSVKSFAKFNTPSPKPSHRSYRYPRLSGGRLPSTPLFFGAASTNPWSTGQSIRHSVRHSSRRVSFAPLPGEEETAKEQPSARSIARPKSPPPLFDGQEGAEDLDDQFSSHFKAVRNRHDQEPKSGLQRLLPTESQQQLSPAVNAMATAFRETDAYHTHILEDCPTPASGLPETAETGESDERIEAPQSPWRSDTQTHAYDDVAAVLHNLDDFLNPRWDTEAPRKPDQRSGGLDHFEDQENWGIIQVGLDGSGTWEMA